MCKGFYLPHGMCNDFYMPHGMRNGEGVIWTLAKKLQTQHLTNWATEPHRIRRHKMTLSKSVMGLGISSWPREHPTGNPLDHSCCSLVASGGLLRDTPSVTRKSLYTYSILLIMSHYFCQEIQRPSSHRTINNPNCFNYCIITSQMVWDWIPSNQ